MSNDKNKIVLLGAGFIADHHLEALRRVSDASVVAVCDLSRTRAERLASQIPGAAPYTDLAACLKEIQPSAVHVLTPPTGHFGPTKQILEAGVDAFVEKPLSPTAEECATLAKLAAARGLALGTSYNFLFAPPYQRLLADIESGRIGRVDQVDVVWNKRLPQWQMGPFGGWLFQDPRNVLFEIGPHSFAHVMHLVGMPEHVQAEARDPVTMPDGRVFHRQWEVQGRRGSVGVRLRFSFIDGYSEHYVHVRGTNASATVDFELNTYLRRENSEDLLDLDRLAATVRGARDALVQGGATWASYVLSKAGFAFEGGPYQAGITRAVRAFYATRRGTLDARLAPQLSTDSIRLGETIAREVKFVGTPHTPPGTKKIGAGAAPAAGKVAPTVLVMGGTGFIGRALVKRLRQEGLGVRALVRSTGGYAELLAKEGAELVKGDFQDTASVEAALGGIQHVYHLARGYGNTWDDYQRLDIEPTRRLGELCAARNVNLYYTSSIAIYSAGKADQVITEDTPPNPASMRINVYARCKVESERVLLELHRTKGLKVVIFRPGIVIGAGGSPYHGGVGAWPYSSICRLWGDGQSPMPFVLVDECADAMVLALKAPNIAGESFNLVGEPCLTGQKYLDEFERLAGIKVRRLPIPPWRYFLEDIAKYGVKTIARNPERVLPSHAFYVGLSCKSPFSPEKAKQRLGWRPSGDLAHVIHEGIAVPTAEFFA
jgi:nucleoside-diphosphate-sugar epimerase/predicted dehydrogenase